MLRLRTPDMASLATESTGQVAILRATGNRATGLPINLHVKLVMVVKLNDERPSLVIATCSARRGMNLRHPCEIKVGQRLERDRKWNF